MLATSYLDKKTLTGSNLRHIIYIYLIHQIILSSAVQDQILPVKVNKI